MDAGTTGGGEMERLDLISSIIFIFNTYWMKWNCHQFIIISHLTSSGRFQFQVEGDGLLCRNSSDCTWLDPELEVGLSHHQIQHILKTFFSQCVNYTFEWIPNPQWFTPLTNLSTPVSDLDASKPVRNFIIQERFLVYM